MNFYFLNVKPKNACFSKELTQKWLMNGHLHFRKDVAISGYVVGYKRSKKRMVQKTYSVGFKDVIEDGLSVSLYV